jgi:hypothetical protein
MCGHNAGRAVATLLTPTPRPRPSRGRGERAALKKDVDMALRCRNVLLKRSITPLTSRSTSDRFRID